MKLTESEIDEIRAAITKGMHKSFPNRVLMADDEKFIINDIWEKLWAKSQKQT